MFLSYLITTHNEVDSLDKLLSKLCSAIKKENQEIVVIDDYSTNLETLNVLDKYSDYIILIQHKLNNHYGNHKNFGIDNCRGEWILQIDADEYPTDLLLENIELILEQNKDNDVIWLPRCNKFSGVTDEDINRYGWKMYEGMVNFPDYQSRLYKNKPSIRHRKRLHERVEGYESYTMIPPQTDYALVHEKTIEQQRKSNDFYFKNFTMDENLGV